MKTARHVATGKIVHASQAEYGGFLGIFECPQCKAALTLRKEYTRSDNITIGAAFIHPASGTEEQKDCRLRVDMSFNISNSNSLSNGSLTQGQVYKLLKRNLLKCLKANSLVNVFEYYQTYRSISSRELKTIALFVNISNSVLKLPQNGLYLLNQIENIKRLILNRKANKIYLENINTSEKLLQEHINRVVWGIQFLIHEAEDDLRKKSISYILGKYTFRSDLDITSDEGRVIRIFGFTGKTLQSVQNVISNKGLISKFYTQMYQNLNASKNIDQETFKRMKKFHNRLFDWVINYFVNFNWATLLG